MKQELERAIVTSGATQEPIDSVRYITNFATGKFGYEIAEALVARGYSVQLMCPTNLQRQYPETPENLEYISFTSTESLQEALLSQSTPTLVFHAAAVSDYTVKEPFNGKMSSNLDEITLTLIKTPKILDRLREQFGRKAFLVGFKLLVGATRQEIIKASREQNTRAHLNLTIANDLTNLHDGQHPVILVTPEGGAINLAGTRQAVAKQVVEFVKKRSQVTWYRSEKAAAEAVIPEAAKQQFQSLLSFAQNTHLLFDSSGNASLRLGEKMVVSPRQVDKSKTTADEAIMVSVNQETRTVFYYGAQKSSIDTAVNDSLYRRYPQLNYLLHFHEPWGVADVCTTFPYPCGVAEEASEIISKVDTVDTQNGFCIELLHHGFLLGLTENSFAALILEWKQSVAEFQLHLNAVGKPETINEGVLKPVFAGNHIVGVVREHPNGAVVFLTEAARGKGVGKKIIEQLIERQMPIQTIDECEVVDFYKKFGFREEKDLDTGMYYFYPPLVEQSDPLFERFDEWRL